MTNITDIIRYFEYIEEKFNLRISFHTSVCAEFIEKYRCEIGKFNAHCGAYCARIKSAALEKCLKQQELVYKNCSHEIFCGMAYCGLEEYIIPIADVDNVYGYISVGGFCTDFKNAAERAKKISAKYGLDSDYLESLLKDAPKPQSKTETEILFRLPSDALAAMMKEYYSEKHISKNNIYAEITAYINENYKNKMTVRDIAAHCYCSESYINHTFKKISSKSVSEYILDLRIEKAKRLLKNTDLPIKAVAEEVGFADSAYFSNVFKRVCGVSAKEYRK